VNRSAIELQIVARIAGAFRDGLRENLENGMGNGAPLQPLGIWNLDDLEFKCPYGDSQADRTNYDTPLFDTGKLFESVDVGSIESMAMCSDGRAGRSYKISIVAVDYGNEQASGGIFKDVHLGRTQAIRESRNFGSLRKGCDYVVRNIVVPARPWNQINRTQVKNIANDAVSGITGG
jgi:hypothetical protein